MTYQKYICLLCGFIYDEAEGWPEDGLDPGTTWEEISDDWTCPECGAMKSDFQMIVIN